MLRKICIKHLINAKGSCSFDFISHKSFFSVSFVTVGIKTGNVTIKGLVGLYMYLTKLSVPKIYILWSKKTLN